MRLGVAIADIAAGMFAYQGLLAALIARGRTGRGQLVDVGLLDCRDVAAHVSGRAGTWRRAIAPGRTGNRHATIAPYDTFDTADGVLVLAVGNDDQWRRFCGAAHLSGLSADARFVTNAGRVTHYADLQPAVQTALRTQPTDAWVTALRDAGVPCGEVRGIDSALADPQVKARAMIERVEHPTIGALDVLGLPVKLSETPGRVRTPPPRLGEHTRRVLREDVMLEDRRIDEMVEAGVVREADTA